MKLYFSPGACSLAVHIVLRETGTPFELVKVDTGAHRTADGADFYGINPKGLVPVLELDNGERMTEGPILAQYICDSASRLDLMPASGSMARYRVLEWQNYITSELHKSFTPLFSSTFDASAKAAHSASIRKKLTWVSAQLAVKNHLAGETFTAADAYLFTVTRWTRFVNIDISDLAPLGRYLDRVASRPAVQAAMKAEGLGA
jgi:glutathione S-transferase